MKRTIYKTVAQAAALLILMATALVFTSFADSKTYTGTLGDAMCGTKHVMDGSASCTQMCVSHGSKYALIIKDKVYTLTTQDKTLLGQFNDLAGKNVSIKGTAHDNIIEVISIKEK
jgi:hypothetical protein